MKEKLQEKIIDEIWGKWISVPMVAVFSFVGIFFLAMETVSKLANNVAEQSSGKESVICVDTTVWIVAALLFFAVNISCIVYVYLNNHIKRASRGKTGILIYIDSANKEIYQDTVRKFGEEFKNAVSLGFEVVYAPFGVKQVDYKSQKVGPLLIRKRCVLLICIRINSDKDKDSLIYDMRINSTIVHLRYPDNVEKEFQKAFSYVLKNFEDVVFPSNEMIKRLRITAKELSYACEYSIGLSLFLNGDYDNSGRILRKMAVIQPTSDQERRVAKSAKRILLTIYISKASYYIEKYQCKWDDERSLNEADRLLEDSLSICGMTYEYCLNKAFCCIARNHDSEGAKKLINLCKQMKDAPKDWKYSEAFLKAYENKTIGGIISSYNDALKLPYNLPFLIAFIETSVIREPGRIGLYLALGILYNSLGDGALMAENIKKYVEASLDKAKTKEILIKKNLYNKEWEKE